MPINGIGAADAQMWINRARGVEDRLSDALHIKLVARFVDRRTSALLKGIGRQTPMATTITNTGEVIAEDHAIGHLTGLVFTPADCDTPEQAKALAAAAAQVVTPVVDKKLTQLAGAGHDMLSLSDTGQIMWGGFQVGALAPGDNLLAPKVSLLGGELGTALLRDMAEGRVRDFMQTEISQKFASLFGLRDFADDAKSYQDSRAVARMLFDHNGLLIRYKVNKTIAELDRVARGHIRSFSTIFSFHYVFMRDLIKPAPARLLSILFCFAFDKFGGGDKTPFLPPDGLTSVADDKKYKEATLK